ncbi:MULTISPECIES: reprolysin-like metallopeptidase [Mesonia]|uniref:Uncharacterized protein n=1 Tax=Mesonia oceanica TaxID=2687242 RepID=A0AC61Y4I2_9FLAO|nr:MULTISPECIES: zinc-dependent metalloprotease family protein [Mesonia]MBJ98459.1 hypothetical protein [Flavobacteriaceae bacterium]VVU99079.1 hypothetical protein FVB9532_00330 [Mesonia oceanica]|tara:strand:+ start:2991 stop:6290 length:3300 start_codon:yes stop_codon:yes gene_type:complete
MNTNLHYVLGLFLFFLTFSISGQNRYWTKISEKDLDPSEKIERSSNPKHYSLFHLDIASFKSAIEDAPNRETFSGVSPIIISFPMGDGHLEKFSVVESSIMEPGLQEKYPQIKTYKAIGVNDATATMRFSVTQFGVHSMSFSGKRNVEYVEPYTKDASNYIAFNRSELLNASNDFECLTEEEIELPSLENTTGKLMDSDDSIHRTYRLALSCTAEYGNIFANTAGDEIADIQAQMTISINRVNEIYERDLGVTLIFVENNDELIYYGNTSDDPWNGEFNDTTQEVIDNTIGNSNYDIGHNFNTSGGGDAGCIGCVCISGQKGSGHTGSNNPVGDAFYIDYVAHEMGHQFGGFHVMNTCNRSGNGTTEVEPASGSSIMGYAGICSSNVQNHSDAHFNYVSVRDITENIKNGASSNCATEIPIDNQPPVADAGNDYIIPISTAFVLEGNATDPDGENTLTYNWSQNDPEQAPSNGAPQPTWEQGPLYRAILPLDSPKRYLPRLEEVVNGNLTPMWEVTPSISREMNFSFIVRDNGSGFSAGIGQTDSDLMKVTVDDSAGPFVITSQNEENITWNEGENQTITWDVSNTNSAPINATNVDVFLSIDGGQNFDINIASGIPNNGSAIITVPYETSTSNARLMVKASENIFYDVNNEDFTIASSSFVFTVENPVEAICVPENAQYNFTYNTSENFNQTTVFSVNNLPEGLLADFNPPSTSENGTEITLTISGTENLEVGAYEIEIAGNSSSVEYTTPVNLNIYDNNLEAPNLLNPENQETDVSETPVLSWQALENANSYGIQLSTDNSFNNILIETEVEDNTYTFTETDFDTTYYWRVKAFNPCTETEYSEVYEFTTTSCSVCPSSGSLQFDIAITLVDFNTISNSSQKTSGYNDYTDQSTTIDLNESYDLSVNSNTGGQFEAYTMVWIDWNQNCSFDDPGEEYELGSAYNTSNGPSENSPLSVIVPNDAVLGPTIMRVSTKIYFPPWNLFAPESCEEDFYGEVEDYTVVVRDPLKNENIKLLDRFVIYPNPNNGRFTISLTPKEEEPIKVNIFDISGRRIFSKTYHYKNQFSESLSLDQAQTGVYFVKVDNGNKSVTKKVIIE